MVLISYIKMVFFFFFSIADIDECDGKEPNNCTSNQFCVNDVGSHHCPCWEGYHLYGVACVPNQAASKLSLAIGLTIGKLFSCSLANFLL